ncbi:duboraya [Polymixia lowei]
MEEEVQPKRSVAELAGRFRNAAAPPEPVRNTEVKPVRRRPPRSLQLPTHTQGDEEKSPSTASPLANKVKRNSALIEKLQANLALSPVSLLPSPKSPGLRLLPPSFTLASPSTTSAPVTTVTPAVTPAVTPTSPVTLPVHHLSKEEVPISFETPPSTAEGAILPSINKGRARLSIRRRPPSRRHRKSSSGEEVGVATGEEDTPLSSPNDPEAETPGGEEQEKDQEVFKDEINKEEPDTGTSVCPGGETEAVTETEDSPTEPQEPAVSSPGETEPDPEPETAGSRAEPQGGEESKERREQGGALPGREVNEGEEEEPDRGDPSGDVSSTDREGQEEEHINGDESEETRC